MTGQISRIRQIEISKQDSIKKECIDTIYGSDCSSLIRKNYLVEDLIHYAKDYSPFIIEIWVDSNGNIVFSDICELSSKVVSFCEILLDTTTDSNELKLKSAELNLTCDDYTFWIDAAHSWCTLKPLLQALDKLASEKRNVKTPKVLPYNSRPLDNKTKQQIISRLKDKHIDCAEFKNNKFFIPICGFELSARELRILEGLIEKTYDKIE